MRVGLLAALEVTVGGETAAVGGAQAGAVLAILALANRRVVPIDELVEGVWGGSPWQRPTVALQSQLSRLRRVLEPRRAPGRPSGVIVRDGGGYRPMVEPGQVDVHRFDALADEGRIRLAAGDAASARTHLVDALSLWRGPALEQAPGAWPAGSRRRPAGSACCSTSVRTSTRERPPNFGGDAPVRRRSALGRTGRRDE